MSEREARPAALRVQVADVAMRASLVSVTPPASDPVRSASKPPSSPVPPEAAVVRRAVRVISDPPPGFDEKRVSVPPSSASSADSGPPSGLTAVPNDQARALNGHAEAAAPTSEQDDWENSAAPESEEREVSDAGGGYDALEVEPLDTLELSDDGYPEEHEGLEEEASDGDLASAVSEAAAALDEVATEDAERREEEGATDLAAQGELAEEGLSPDEALEDEPFEDEALAQEEHDEDELEMEDGEAHLIEMSTPPPPAPTHALRRTPPSNDVDLADDDGEDVEISAADEDEDESQRTSGEFEELDVDPDAPPSDAPRSMPPPPPPPAPRISIAEPPDLKTLTRSARVQELRPSKPRAHAWWEVFFDDDYLRTVRMPTPEQVSRTCDFVQRRTGLKPGATLLDVGCGLGQMVIELTARGYLGVGLDLSLAMLSRASEEAQARGMRINFLHADMREMNFEGAFDAVTCLGTTLGYFDDEANRKVIERFHRALKPGGVLLLDVVNRDHVIRSQPNLIWFEGDGCVCMEESEFNFFTSRLHVKRTVILDTGKQLEHEYSLRLYSLHELGQMLHTNGFRVTEVSGREALPGVFFGQDSPNLMIVAERRIQDPLRQGEPTGRFGTLPES